MKQTINTFNMILIFLSFSREGFASQQCQNLFSKEIYSNNKIEKEAIFNKTPSVDPTSFKTEKIWNFKHSPNKPKFEAYLRMKYDKYTVLQSAELQNNRRIELIRNGFGKSQEIVLFDGNSKKTIFSNFIDKRNNSMRIESFKLSNDQSKLVIVTYLNGSTDIYELFVYDLNIEKIIKRGLRAHSLEIFWTNSNKFLYTSRNEITNSKILISFDYENPNSIINSNWDILYHSYDNWAYGASNGKIQFYNRKNGKAYNFKSSEIHLKGDSTIIGEMDGQLLMRTKGMKWGYDQIIRLEINENTMIGKILYPEFLLLYNKVQIKDQFILIYGYYGKNQHLIILDNNGKYISNILIPDGCSYDNSQWIHPGSVLEVTLKSPFVDNQKFNYDISLKKFIETDPKETLYNINDQKYETQVYEALSADGTLIPFRIYYSANFQRNQKRPTIIEAYGGFNRNSTYFYSESKFNNTDFFTQGGIYVAPAIRGGGEMGPKWHKVATGKFKTKTIEDLVAVSKKLVELELTSADNIILKGTSNGGMITASAGLMSPQSFGMIVSFSGVYDLDKIEQLDPKFASYWLTEYGIESKTYSTVNLAINNKKSLPMLVFSGKQDTRVNPQHTINLESAIKQNENISPGTIQFIKINNAGHWLESFHYQDTIGWRSQVVMWTAIYDFFNLQFESIH